MGTNGNLREFRSRLREHRLLCENTRYTGEFQVIGMYRYSASESFLKSLSPPVSIPKKHVVFLFDIIITDRKDKQKCFLAFPLGRFVEQQKLRIGAFVRINSAKLCFWEGDFSDRHLIMYILIEDLTITYRNFTLPALQNLIFLPTSNPRESQCCPLVTSRKCYLDPWMTTSPTGDDWRIDSYVEWNDNMQRPLSMISLTDLHHDWKTLPKPHPAILIRVIDRTVLYPYGYCDNDRPYPFFRTFSAADNTGCIGVVIFAELNKGSNAATSPNAILLIEHYTVEESARLLPFPPIVTNINALSNTLLPISIKSNKLTKITIVPPNSVVFRDDIALLPIKKYQFIDRLHLQNAANDSKVNVIGLVTYVSFFYRVPYKYGNYLSMVWVEMIDKSSHLPFRILLFEVKNRCSIELRPGKFLVCTNMVVKLSEDAFRPDDIYLQSSVYSEFYTKHGNMSGYMKHPIVNNIADIRRSQNQQELAIVREDMFRLGGMLSYPKLYKEISTNEEGRRKMIPGAAWSSTLEELGCRELKRVLLCGHIIRVDYVDFQTANSEDPVYGWTYADEIRSSHFVYFNVALTSYLRGIGLSPLNSLNVKKSMFPLKHTTDSEDELLRHVAHHPTSAEDWKPIDSARIASLPTSVTGVYVVNIASIHFQSMLQCVFVPEPSAKPHPSFCDLLSGKFQPLPFRQMDNTFLGEPPIYTLPEFWQARRTVSEVTNKTFVFVADLFNPGLDEEKFVVLHQAIVCPIDQMVTFTAANFSTNQSQQI